MIKFNRTLSFLGRNGSFKCSGIEVSEYDGCRMVILEPVTSKDTIGRAQLQIPYENIRDLINELQEIQEKNR